MRIAIVNDSALAREAIERALRTVADYSVAWTAEDGAIALRKAIADPPDAILMDLIMPGTDGVEATRQIMAVRPCPILLVTSSVCSNFSRVSEAIGYGGIDAVNTPTIGLDGSVGGAESLMSKLDRIARNRRAVVPPETIRLPFVVAIGASTGGPSAIEKILSDLPSDLPAAIVIAQHLDAEFIPGLISSLQNRTRLPVRKATPGGILEPGTVYVACTNDHMVLNRSRQLVYVAEPASLAFRPSVNELFTSLADNWPEPGLAILLTGMGTDGASGLLRLRQACWRTIAQDEASSVVYGMPKEAARLRAAEQILPLSQISGAISAAAQRTR